jgi:hypothetical protein
MEYVADVNIEWTAKLQPDPSNAWLLSVTMSDVAVAELDELQEAARGMVEEWLRQGASVFPYRLMKAISIIQTGVADSVLRRSEPRRVTSCI